MGAMFLGAPVPAFSYREGQWPKGMDCAHAEGKRARDGQNGGNPDRFEDCKMGFPQLNGKLTTAI
jgi:hypothetical protein